jgi:hypothetical protein
MTVGARLRARQERRGEERVEGMRRVRDAGEVGEGVWSFRLLRWVGVCQPPTTE